MFSLEIDPVLGERAASLRNPAAAAIAQAPAPADYAPAAATSTVLPPFELSAVEDPSEAGLVELTPPALCGICVPVPAPEPAVCDVQHRAVPEWQWPQTSVTYPAGAVVETRPALARVEQFAAPPAAQPAEILMHCAACAGPMEAVITVQLPVSLRRTLETAVAPLAPLASAPAAEMVASTALPSASMEAISDAARLQEPVLLPESLPAALQTAVPLAGAAPESVPDGVAQPGVPAAALEAVQAPAAPAMHSVWVPEQAPQIALPLVAGAAPRDYPALPVESLPNVAFAAQPIIRAFSLYYPKFHLAPQGVSTSVVEAGEAASPAAAAPGQTGPVELPLAWMPGIALASPQAAFTASTETAIPESGPVPLEFYCKRANSVPVAPLSWMMPAPRLRRPHMSLSPVLPELEPPAVVAPPRKKASPQILQIPGRKSSSLLREIAKPLAACFLVGAFVWLGATAMRVGTRTAAVNRDVATLIQAEKDSTVIEQDKSSASADATRSASKSAPAAAQQPGLMSRVRQAIASRAASQLTENFHEGMGAWSNGAKSAAVSAPSWARSAEGFIRPASFGLFRPSANYKDYRVEFFGQIEQKSVSWAVRASDPKNYYGMKVTVVEPGPRPVVAVEHYPVVDGKKGRNTRVPLPELMYHNNTPYHIEVAVHGNRVTTSIEGQEVDSWLDDALPKKGGVGFFADAGERSRVYWMKVVKNEDFLGRVCAYISGSAGGTVDTADLRPGRPSVPASNAPVESADIALAVFAFRGSQNRRRSAPWSL